MPPDVLLKVCPGVETVPLTWRPTDCVFELSAGAAKVVLLLAVKFPPTMTLVWYGAPDVSGVPSAFTE